MEIQLKAGRGPRRQVLIAGVVDRRIAFLGYGACSMAGCLWGTGFYFGRLALNEMSVEHMVLYRFLFASLGMLPVALVCRIADAFGSPRRDAPAAPLRVSGRSGPVSASVSRPGPHHGQPRLADGGRHAGAAGRRGRALCRASGLTGFGWLALFGSTVGAALIALGGSRGPAAHGEPTLTGDLLVVASLATALAWILLSKKLMMTHSPLGGDRLHHPLRNCDAGRLSSRPLAAEPLDSRQGSRRCPLPTSAPPPGALAISGLLCTATTTLLWNWGIHHVPASRAGVF
jgi:drug/metabolite transporter (DMT)-like permease